MADHPATPDAQAAPTVRRRAVFFIPGFDPFPPRRYREMYRSESAAQAQISGYDISMKSTSGQGSTRWQVKSRIEGQAVEADVQVLLWSDIVQASMTRGIFATYLLMLNTAWVYLRSGALRRLMRLRAGPMLAALYPVAMLIAQLAVAVALAALVGWLAGAMLGILVDRIGAAWVGTAAAQAASLLMAVSVFVATLRWFRARDRRIYAYYLMHDFGFSAQHGGALAPVLPPRIAEFSAAISAAMESDVDEVLVVGHSSGADIAVMVLGDLLRSDRLPAAGPALSLLTLGQAIPMTSFLPEARQLRADLHLLAAQSLIPWVDVSAPGDGASFALCDPVAVSGVSPPDKRWPLVISAAFSQTLKPETLTALRRRFFRLHAQYLCAFDNPGEYDYFRVTAGPQTLAERFAHRKPSASRIEVATSPHTTMAA